MNNVAGAIRRLVFVVLMISYNSFLCATDMSIAVQRKGHVLVVPLENLDGFLFESDDQISFISNSPHLQPLQTPDGNFHVKTEKGVAFRIPSLMRWLPFQSYMVPEHLCMLSGAGVDTLEPIGRHHIKNYMKYMGLWPEMSFLEIGCGIGRDAFQLISILNEQGLYIGTDVTSDSIRWVQKNITSMHPNFKFHHFDIYHELYNPLGTFKTSDFLLPAEDASIDRIALGSVFTHLFEEEVVHYLKEIRRVLKPGGLVYATFFLYESNAVSASREKSMTPFNLRFEHSYADGCYINDKNYPTGAVAYTYEALMRMTEKAGLILKAPMIRGCWSGLFPDAEDGQDVMILGV